MTFEAGDIVLYRDEVDPSKTQRVALVKQTTEPRWADEPVWEFLTLEESSMFGKGEVSFARDEDIEKI